MASLHVSDEGIARPAAWRATVACTLRVNILGRRHGPEPPPFASRQGPGEHLKLGRSSAVSRRYRGRECADPGATGDKPVDEFCIVCEGLRFLSTRFCKTDSNYYCRRDATEFEYLRHARVTGTQVPASAPPGKAGGPAPSPSR